jgi:hypothetical protein
MSQSNNTPSTDHIISRLRPRSLGEILDQSFRLYRKHFLTFFAMAAVVYIPVQLGVQLASAFLQGSALNLDSEFYSMTRQEMNERTINLLLSSGVVIVLGLLAGLVQYVSQGALTAAVADSHMDRPVSFGRGYSEMWKRVGPLVGAIVIQVLVTIGVFVPVVGLFLLASTTGSDGGAGGLGLVCLGFLATIAASIFYVYIYIRWTVVVPAIMVEGLGAREGLRRSWQLVESYWWRTVGLVVLLAILVSLIAGGPAFVLTILFALIFRTLDPVMLIILSGVISVLISALLVPLQLIAVTLYYFDLRVRKEGFDLETAMAQRYWPQYGAPYGQPYGAPYGGPPLGWATGQGQYMLHGQEWLPPNAEGPAPPVLGEAPAQGYGSGYRPPPTEEPADEGLQGDEGIGGDESVKGPPASDEPGQEEAESQARGTDMGQATSPTPDWLTPPVLGARRGDEEVTESERAYGEEESATDEERTKE